MSDIYAVLLGVAASLASWWIISRLLTPRLAVSNEISKLPAVEFGPWRYRIKITNRSWWRQPAVEIKMKASLRVHGLTYNSWSNYPIPLGHTGEMDMINRSATPRLQLHEMKEQHRLLIAEHLRNHQGIEIPVDERRFPLLTLEQILSVGKKAEIRIVISGAHPYTGSRRAIVTHHDARHVICGWFHKESLRVVRDDTQCEETGRSPTRS